MPEEIHIGPDGTRYLFAGSIQTTPTTDTKPKPVAVRFKTFWKTERKWSGDDIVDYQNTVPQLVRQIVVERYWDRQGRVATNRFTCEDFAVRVLVQFAASRGLPLKLTTGVRAYRNVEAYGKPEHSRYESTMYGFADMVETTFGAPDMQRVGSNTLQVDSPARLMPGDILALAHDFKGRQLNGRAHHIQIVASVSPSAIRIYQGNSGNTIHWPIPWIYKLFGRNAANPQQSIYAGLPVETGRFEQRGKEWDYTNDKTGRLERDYIKYFDLYRWNFPEFNK